MEGRPPFSASTQYTSLWGHHWRRVNLTAYIGVQEVDCEVQILLIYWRIKIKKWNLNPHSKLKACVVFCLLLLELLYNTMHLYFIVMVFRLLIIDHVFYWNIIIFTLKQELPKYVWHVLTSAYTIRHAHSYIAYTKLYDDHNHSYCWNIIAFNRNQESTKYTTSASGISTWPSVHPISRVIMIITTVTLKILPNVVVQKQEGKDPPPHLMHFIKLGNMYNCSVKKVLEEETRWGVWPTIWPQMGYLSWNAKPAHVL